jgi:hypothetical protein
MDKNNAVSFLLGIILCISIMFLTIIAYKLEVKPQVIYAENRTPDNAYVDIVSRTEYYANETGQVIVRVSDGLGNPLTASCNASIVFPNKTYWIIDTSLSSSSITGNYYKEVTIPDVLGVYEYYFVCNVTFSGKSQIVKKSATFHVSIAYQKFQEIIDKLNALNDTLVQMNNTIIQMNQTIMNEINNLKNNMTLNFNYTNELILNISANNTNSTQDILNELNDLRSWIDIKFYELEQKWIDIITNLFEKVLGVPAKEVQRIIGQTTGVTSDCSLFNRIIGKC